MKKPSFMGLTATEQKEILETAAVELGQTAVILEKDLWVCWVLDVLFSMPNRHPMAFKGGTSLSKVYQAIDRFSEDIDITLDYRHFGDNFDPLSSAVSKTQIRKFGERLKEHVKRHTHEVIVPHLQTCAQVLPRGKEYKIVIEDDIGEKIRFIYPSVLRAANDYIDSSVLLEFGGRNVVEPHQISTVAPYVAKVAPMLSYPACEQVVVLSLERTFWEKATLVHVECHRGELRASAHRLSRHWYDLVMLAKHPRGQLAMSNRILLKEVITHKKLFFNASYANYDACLAGKLRLVPSGDSLQQLKVDYEEMLRSGMLQSPLDFDAVIADIQSLEKKINT